ncbi:MAG: 8-oxo-dGTP diphosphatase [Verrucomicrobiales bacterium]
MGKEEEHATLCFIRREGRILLIKKLRGLGAGKVNGPGGKVEPGEAALDCAIRETQEEICVTPLDLNKQADLSFEFTDGYRLHCEVFFAKDFIGQPQNTEEAEPFWVSEDQIPYDLMWADDSQWLPLALAGHYVTGVFQFDGDRLLDSRVTCGEFHPDG